MKNNKLLKEGDVIFLATGMKVYAEIPEKFVYGNKKLSKELTTHEVVVGENIGNDTDLSEDRNDLVKDIVDAFDFRLGFKLKKSEALEFIVLKTKSVKSESFLLEEGEFVVTQTQFTGGGHGMGMNDEYPNGHHITCKKLKDGQYDPKGIEITFYQSGSFTAMILPEKIKAIRQMERKFV
jgi:hypothetical protein